MGGTGKYKAMDQPRHYDAYSLPEAKEQLDALVERVEAGESIDIVRAGKLVARIIPMAETSADNASEPPARRPFDVEALRRHLARMPNQEQDAGTFVRQMRDGYRY
jgi:prevent-host-death family protein